MPTPRICVSLPVHEQPAVILDQVENLRAFLPADTQIVLHLSQSLGADPAAVAPLLPDGVHVNPRSHPTQWGDIVHLHNDNVRFALDQLEPFDDVLLHASNDLYLRAGAERYVASAPAGATAFVADDPAWPPAAAGRRDEMLLAILSDLGTDEIRGSRVEGSWYATELFREMLDRIERHLRPGEGEHYVREEVYYPSVAARLSDGPFAAPLVYWDAELSRPVAPATVWGLLDGSFTDGDPSVDFDHVYAVKKVDRVLHDRTREVIRAVGRARGGRLRLRPPFDARRFVVLAFAADVLADDGLLRAWTATFTGSDEVTLAIHISEAESDRVPEVVAAAERAGADSPDAPDATLVSTRPGSFDEAALRFGVQALYRPDGAQAPPLLDDVPLFGPGSVTGVRGLAERFGRATRP